MRNKVYLRAYVRQNGKINMYMTTKNWRSVKNSKTGSGQWIKKDKQKFSLQIFIQLCFGVTDFVFKIISTPFFFVAYTTFFYSIIITIHRAMLAANLKGYRDKGFPTDAEMVIHSERDASHCVRSHRAMHVTLTGGSCSVTWDFGNCGDRESNNVCTVVKMARYCQPHIGP